MPAETFVSLIELFETLDEIPGFPLDRLMPSGDTAAIMQDVGFTDVGATETPTTLTEQLTLAVRREVAFDLPGLAGFQLVIGRGSGFFELPMEIEVDLTGSDPTFRALRITGQIALRFPRSVLMPMELRNGAWLEIPDEHREFVISSTVTFAANGEVTIAGPGAFALEASMIGNSGVIVSASDVALVFSDAAIPAGAPAGFRGVYIGSASLAMRDPGFPVTGLTLQNAAIGSGGFSGDVDLDLNLSGTLAGFEFILTHFGLTIIQNAITASDIRGRVTVPFFEGPVDVNLALSADGSFAVGLASATGLASLDIEGLLELQLNAFEFARRQGVPEISLSGSMQLAFSSDLELPRFEVKRLTINDRGEVTIDGGWIDLGDALSFSFYGFQMEITRVGFGSDGQGVSRRNWIGLSGGLKLVDGLALGANVDGLRISWSASAIGPADLDVQLTIAGIGVDVAIPDVLEFRGTVYFLNDPATATQGFAGDVHLTLPTLNFTGEASILVGKRAGLTFFYLAVAADLPLGLPLGQTGVAFYGFQGLIGVSVYPNKTPEQHWYEDWYMKPTPGVTAAMKWYPPVPDAFAIGLGATLGTFPDNGFAVSGKVLIALVLPGPLLLIEGRANFLASRGDLNSTDPSKPPFRALLVLDGREGTLLLNIGATYEKAPLIRLAALAEAFFDFTDPGAWHLYLGVDEPREKRVQALALEFLTAQAYWMLSARDLRFGAWAGYDGRWGFGPLEVALEAWVDGGARVGFDPLQMAAFLHLHGAVALRAFGLGIGLSVDARLEAEAPKPFRVRGDFDVELGLPWPLPDLEAHITLEWKGPPDPPDFPIVIKSIDLEHALTGGTWRGLEGPTTRSIPASQPVPVDARPVITFGRPVADDVGFTGAAGTTPYEVEMAGGYTFEHRLAEVTLEDITIPGSPAAVTPRFGAWKSAAAADKSVASKLEIWSKNPFEYHHASNTAYADWLVNNVPDLLCGSKALEKPVCQDFDGVQAGQSYTAPFTVGVLTCTPGLRDAVVGGVLAGPGAPRPVLELSFVRDFRVRFSTAVESVQVLLLAASRVTIVAFHDGSEVARRDVQADLGQQTIALGGLAVDQLRFVGAQCRLLQLCWLPLGTEERTIHQDLLRQITAESVTQWYSEDPIFLPDRDYLITVRTQSTRQGPAGETTQDQTASLTFRTAAPPGLIPKVHWVSPATGDPSSGNAYDSLAPYVARTIPADGERPVYRSYDVAVHFNQNYVEAMYTGDVRIRLFAPGEREITTAAGLPSVWGSGRQVTLTESEALWLRTLEQMRCKTVAVDWTGIQQDTTLRTHDAALLLEPGLRHEARVFASGVEAYRFSFVTSRYRDFREHMATFSGTVWLDTVAAPDPTRLESLAAAARAGGMALDLAEAGLFEELYYDVLGLPQRRLPDLVEWSEVRPPDGAIALLLASPEPLDWRRITVDVKRRVRALLGPGIPGVIREQYQPVDTVWVRHADGARALVFFPSATAAAGPAPFGRMRITYTFARDAGTSLPVLSVAGDTSAETAAHSLVLPVS